jgi:hypothetical protein
VTSQEPSGSEDENLNETPAISENDSDSDHSSQSGDDADNDERGQFLTTEELTSLQGRTLRTVHVEVFPGTHAGAVHSTGIPTMKEFENDLGGPPSNPYSPFNSQTDWELAKWAKLRGPGSTAFTELLAVTGVRLFLISLDHSLTSKIAP